MRTYILFNIAQELCELRYISKPRVSNNNPFFESLIRAAKYQTDYTS